MEKFVFLAIIAVAAWYWLKPKRKARPAIDRAEACAILGVAPHADADAIRAAHRRLVSAVHPDRGGSAELTRRINVARDVLLARAVD